MLENYSSTSAYHHCNWSSTIYHTTPIIKQTIYETYQVIMKLLYSYANLLAIFNHRVISGVHAKTSNRQLQLNQAEAAKRVDDAVDQAMLSVENGDVTGVAFPLNYVILSSEFGSEQQLTVNLRLPGVDRNQNMWVDTGMLQFVF